MDMQTKECLFLEWDSDFFGFPVAMVPRKDITADHLERILISLKKNGARLVYWAFESGNDISYEAIQRLNGLLVDQKTTFFLKMEKDHRFLDSPCSVEEGSPYPSFSNLDALAEQCGQYSRFAVDPHIPRNKSAELYRLWIEKSFKKEMADAVFVVKAGFKLNGLITLKKNEVSKSGEIGLLVVDTGSRNQHIGSRLVETGLRWLRQSNLLEVRVVTQGANETACRFYETCGFVKEHCVNFYHFWL